MPFASKLFPFLKVIFTFFAVLKLSMITIRNHPSHSKYPRKNLKGGAQKIRMENLVDRKFSKTVQRFTSKIDFSECIFGKKHKEPSLPPSISQNNISTQSPAPSISPTIVTTQSPAPSIHPSISVILPNDESLGLFGWNVAIHENFMVICDVSYQWDEMKPSIYDTDGTFIANLVPPDSDRWDMFGFSVDISDSRIIVGSPQEDVPGSAYQFDAKGVFLQKLAAPDGEIGDLFGTSVAISKSNILIGAKNMRHGEGRAYFFDLDGILIQTLLPPVDTNVRVYSFGRNVAISDSHILIGKYDLNTNASCLFDITGQFITNLGLMTFDMSNSHIIFGARGEHGESGSAYLFDTNGALITKILPPEGDEYSSRFGYGVAISDKYIVISCFSSELGVYIYDLTGKYVKKLLPEEGALSLFGFSVATFGDKIVISSPSYNDEMDGKVFVYQ